MGLLALKSAWRQRRWGCWALRPRRNELALTDPAPCRNISGGWRGGRVRPTNRRCANFGQTKPNRVAWATSQDSAYRPRRAERKAAEQADDGNEVQNCLPHRDLILQRQRGRSARRPLLDLHETMFVRRTPRDQFDQRLRLIGKAVGLDFDAAQQVITLKYGAVVVSHV